MDPNTLHAKLRPVWLHYHNSIGGEFDDGMYTDQAEFNSRMSGICAGLELAYAELVQGDVGRIITPLSEEA